MAGTNFWGTEKEVGQFSAPSMDDKLMEVVGITGFTHLATSKILGIQNQRLAQCRCAKVTILTQLAMQVDGEAWMQEPGTIVVTHKNKARMMVKDKVCVCVCVCVCVHACVRVCPSLPPSLHPSLLTPLSLSYAGI